MHNKMLIKTTKVNGFIGLYMPSDLESGFEGCCTPLPIGNWLSIRERSQAKLNKNVYSDRSQIFRHRFFKQKGKHKCIHTPTHILTHMHRLAHISIPIPIHSLFCIVLYCIQCSLARFHTITNRVAIELYTGYRVP